jgi:hypothetical protein
VLRAAMAADAAALPAPTTMTSASKVFADISIRSSCRQRCLGITPSPIERGLGEG